uniref:Uncharacterized protein n=1 Tax=Oryza glumipatula TaxID=40148 RepID=A0A0D9ZQ27_9ORYZ
MEECRRFNSSSQPSPSAFPAEWCAAAASVQFVFWTGESSGRSTPLRRAINAAALPRSGRRTPTPVTLQYPLLPRIISPGSHEPAPANPSHPPPAAAAPMEMAGGKHSTTDTPPGLRFKDSPIGTLASPLAVDVPTQLLLLELKPLSS